MKLTGILLYVARAGAAAVCACAIWALFRIFLHRRRKAPVRLLREGYLLLCVAYITALLEITVWRGGTRIPERSCYLIPLDTTIRSLKLGLWNFVYHLVGNMIWFVPFGCMLAIGRAKLRPWQALLAGALLSACIEAAQFIRCSGTLDVDDILINALGTLAGWAFVRLIARMRRQRHV